MPSAPRQLVAAQQRRGGARRRARPAPAGSTSRASSTWRSIASLGLAAARGEAVGDGQQRDVDLDRLGRREVAVERRGASSGRLVHEEAEAQVVAGERRDVRAQPLARRSRREDVARELRALRRRGRGSRRLAVVAHDRASRGLAASCSSAPQRRPVAAGQPVGERLGEQRARSASACSAPSDGGRVALERERLLEHLERVAVDVAVVVAVLLDAVQRGELGQHDRRSAPSVVQQPDARAAPRRREQDALELGEDALAGDPRRARPRAARAAAAVARVDREAELEREAREPHDAQRVVGERARAEPARSTPRGEVGAAAVGSTSSPPASGSAIALTVKSRSAQVGVERCRRGAG